MTLTLHIRLLGNFQVQWNNTPVSTITVPRLQSLLAYLVMHHGIPQDRSRLAFLFWPDSSEAQAHTNLRKLLYQLRQALPDADHFLQADKQSLQWLPSQPHAPWTLDVIEIEQAHAQARQAEQTHDTVAMRRALEQVVHLYRGDLFPECYDEWIIPERDRLHQLFLQVAERLIMLLEQERDYDAAIAITQQLLRQDTLHESTYRQLMGLYALQGNRAAALRVYHTCATVLERELGIEPSTITREVYESLLRTEASPGIQASPRTARGAAPPLSGRKTEWRQLQQVWHRTTNGPAHIVLLTGEAGIGKTRLAEEMEAWVSRQGLATATARCYMVPGQLAYAPVTTWLRSDALQAGLASLDPVWLTEIARLMPEVLATQPDIPHPAAMAEGWQRRKFFEALAHAFLTVRQPVLLLLDDMQWCDNETLEWLHYLIRFTPQARWLLIGTIRLEEILTDHPLTSLLGTLQRDGLVTEIPLAPLTTAETIALAEHIMERRLDPAMSDILYAETEGNPLFVVEMARAGTLEQRANEQASGKSSFPLRTPSTSTLPPSVQTVLAARLAQLSPQAQSVANVAAVIGRAFPFNVLAQACGESEDTVVRGLDELWQRRIVREQSAGSAETYDFSHDKLREHVYTSLGPASRRLLHRRVAEACKTLYREDLDAVSGQIALHYERAGLPTQAIPYYQRAGKAARHIYAHTEAIYALEQAIALLEAPHSGQIRSDVPWSTIVSVYECLGEILLETGRHQEARQIFEQAIAALLPEEPIAFARLKRKMANAWNHESNNLRDSFNVNAREAFQEAERILTRAADPGNPAWHHEWAELQFAQLWPIRGSVDDMTAAIEKARPSVEQYGSEEQRERLTFSIIMRDLAHNRYVVSQEQMISLRSRLLTIQKAENKTKQGIGHLALGGILLWSGQLQEAEEQFQSALQIGEHTETTWLQARCLTFLSFIYRQHGQVEQVRTILSRAQAAGLERNNSPLMGQRAWIAWRDGNLSEAETLGLASIEEKPHQHMEHNSFQWVGLWPLIGVALTQERYSEAIDTIRMLLTPAQQSPPEHLKTLLETVVHTWDTGQQSEAHTLLLQVMPLAKQMGYL